MVVIEVFTPVVQRILKHNMVSTGAGSLGWVGGWVWLVAVSELGARAACPSGLFPVKQTAKSLSS
jgi:hypothetical protein